MIIVILLLGIVLLMLGVMLYLVMATPAKPKRRKSGFSSMVLIKKRHTKGSGQSG